MKSGSSNLVEIRIRQPNSVAEARILGRLEAFFCREDDDFVFRSRLGAEVSVGEHLKWLYGMLQDQQRFFRQLKAEGAPAVICIRSGQRPLLIEPDALLLAHQLHLVTEIRSGK